MFALTRWRRRPGTILGPFLIGLLAMSLLACAGGGPAPTVPGAPGASGSPAASPGGAAAGPSQDPQDAMLAYAKCMRDNGVDFPDPQPISGTGGQIQAINIDPTSPEFQKAQTACASKLPAFGGNLDPVANQKFQDQMLAFAKCMRGHGIDFPDPKFDSGGGASAIEVTGNVAPDSPAFQDAQKACGSNLPGGGTVVTSGGGVVTTP